MERAELMITCCAERHLFGDALPGLLFDLCHMSRVGIRFSP
jgi:hypothetical protein